MEAAGESWDLPIRTSDGNGPCVRLFGRGEWPRRLEGDRPRHRRRRVGRARRGNTPTGSVDAASHWRRRSIAPRPSSTRRRRPRATNCTGRWPEGGWPVRRTVVDGEPRVVEVTDERRPLVRGVRHCFTYGRLGQHPRALLRQPVGERGQDRRGVLLAVCGEVGPGQLLLLRLLLDGVQGADAGQRLVRPLGVGESGVEEVPPDARPAPDPRRTALENGVVPGIPVGVYEPGVPARNAAGASRDRPTDRSNTVYGLAASPTYTQAWDVRPGASSGTGVSSVCSEAESRTRSHISRYSGSSTPEHAMIWSHRVDRVTTHPSRPRIDSWRYSGR
jgi:hypothetical protein